MSKATSELLYYKTEQIVTWLLGFLDFFSFSF